MLHMFDCWLIGTTACGFDSTGRSVVYELKFQIEFAPTVTVENFESLIQTY